MPRKKAETVLTEEEMQGTAAEPAPETANAPDAEEADKHADTVAVVEPVAEEKTEILLLGKEEKEEEETTQQPEKAVEAAGTETKPAAQAASRVISIDGREHSSQRQRPDTLAEVRRDIRQGRILTGEMYSVGATASRMPFAVLLYKDLRVIIPAEEMIDLTAYAEADNPVREINGTLNAMLGAEIDFIPKGADEESGLVTGSRKEAMQQLRERFYVRPTIAGQPLLLEGGLAEARVIAVSPKMVDIELFGVDTVISAQELAWDWITDAREVFHVGEHVVVRILEIAHKEQGIGLKASIRQTIKDPFEDIDAKLQRQQNYVGTIKTGGEYSVRVALPANLDAVCPIPDWMNTIIPGTKVSVKVTRIDLTDRRINGRILRIIQEV